jgi:hypothetical protein
VITDSDRFWSLIGRYYDPATGQSLTSIRQSPSLGIRPPTPLTTQSTGRTLRALHYAGKTFLSVSVIATWRKLSGEPGVLLATNLAAYDEGFPLYEPGIGGLTNPDVIGLGDGESRFQCEKW